MTWATWQPSPMMMRTWAEERVPLDPLAELLGGERGAVAQEVAEAAPLLGDLPRRVQPRTPDAMRARDDGRSRSPMRRALGTQTELGALSAAQDAAFLERMSITHVLTVLPHDPPALAPGIQSSPVCAKRIRSEDL